LLVVGVLAAVASPQFAVALSHYRIEAAAARIIADLNYVRQVAISTSTERRLKFRALPDSSDHYHSTGAHPVTDPYHPGVTYDVLLSQFFPGVELQLASFDGSDEIVFNHYGLPLAGVPLTSITAGTLVIAAGTEQRTIVIDPATGKASVQ
jgi:Tfp pilus assembly protein FimT